MGENAIGFKGAEGLAEGISKLTHLSVLNLTIDNN